MTDTDKRNAAQIYLEQIKNMAEQLAKLEELIQAERDKLSLPARSYREPVTGGRRFDAFAGKLAADLDRQTALDELTIKYYLLRDDFLDKLLKLEDPAHVEVLYSRFWKLEKPDETAKRNGYSTKHYHRLKNAALIAFYSLYDKDIDEYIKTRQTGDFEA